jgi:hypothetical protein
VAVYLGADETLSPLHLLYFICDRWRADGIDVVVLDDPARVVDADVALMHVDVTRRPAAYDAAAIHYPRVINGRVRDISKRRISAHLVSRGSDYPGPVIVKSNGNSFDHPDHRHKRPRGRLPRLWSRVVDRMAPTLAEIRASGTYPIFASRAEVPPSVWYDPRLVVEKFLPERQDGLYCLRTWVFFGDRESATISFSESPVVKRHNTLRFEPIPEIPDALRTARRRLGFDYGKFDFVLHAGVPILLDTNSTPGCSGKRSERLDALAENLAAGLFAESTASLAG